jgi:hypothetical protein
LLRRESPASTGWLLSNGAVAKSRHRMGRAGLTYLNGSAKTPKDQSRDLPGRGIAFDVAYNEPAKRCRARALTADR